MPPPPACLLALEPAPLRMLFSIFRPFALTGRLLWMQLQRPPEQMGALLWTQTQCGLEQHSHNTTMGGYHYIS